MGKQICQWDIYTKKYSFWNKPIIQLILANDVVVVEGISRLGRNMLDILNLIQLLHQKQIKFIYLKENMDTATATGRAMLQMMGVIAELERNLLADRVKEGDYS